jgi:glycosyltransferase involved in cell wall biosynthesis
MLNRAITVLKGANIFAYSLVVITLNEADRIGRCLESVHGASEVVVVDSGSTDDTVALATGLGARVVETDWPGHVAQKNRALALVNTEWVLSLDADEWLSDEMVAYLNGLTEKDLEGIDGVSFSRCSTWLGKRLRHGKWYPDRRIRLVRRVRAQWGGDDPHDTLQVEGLVITADVDIEHVPYRSLREQFDTIDRYTAIAAKSLCARGARARWFDIVGRPPLHFIVAYILKRGFLDGLAGFWVALLGAYYTGLKWTRLYKMAVR